MKALLLSVALLAFPVQDLSAQGAKAVQRLRRAPVSAEVLKVRLPRPVKATLPNGLTVIVVEQHKLPTVAFSLWVRTGPLSDPADLPGLAEFTAQMLEEGTKSRSSEILSRQIEELGANVNAYAPWGGDLSQVQAGGMVEDADRILELMRDVATNPAFSPEELEKYKKRRLAQLEEQRAQPRFLAQERLRAALYGGFPAGRASATPEAVGKANADELRAFHAKHYVPSNAVLGIAGDLTPEKALSLVKKRFGDWKGAAPSKAPLPALAPAPAKAVILVERPGSVQTEIMAGARALKRVEPDYIPVVVANRVLGGGPSARLFLNLREEKGYTYGAYSYLAADLYPGPWNAWTAVRTEVTEPALKDLLAEFARLRDEPVPADELSEAKSSIVAKFALSLESPQALLDSWLTVEYYGLPQDYWDRYPEAVSAVNAETVRRVAQTYLAPANLQLACVGDPAKVKALLGQFGPLTSYDTSGKPK